MRSRTKILLQPAILLAIATPTLAVVVSLEATDGAGDPLVRATITIGDVEARTDERGRATLDIPAESGEEVDVVVMVGGDVVFEDRIRVTTAGPIRLRTSAPAGRAGRPSPAGSPGAFGNRRPSLLGSVRSERIETELASQSFVIRTTVPTTTTGSGTTTTEESGSLSPQEIAEARTKEGKRHEIPIAYGVDAIFPIPAIGGSGTNRFVRPLVTGFGTALPRRFARTTGLPALVDDGADSSGSDGRSGARFFPAITAGIAQADVEFHSESLEDGARTTFEGDGLVYRLGIQGTLVPCGDCRWFGTLAYIRAWTEDIDATRTPGLQGAVPEGINVAQDRIGYSSETHSVRLVAGRAFEHVTPWFGVRADRWQGELDFDILLTVVDGAAQQSQSARNEYEEDLILAIAGVDIAVPRSRVVIRVEGSSDGDSRELGAGVGVSF